MAPARPSGTSRPSGATAAEIRPPARMPRPPRPTTERNVRRPIRCCAITSPYAPARAPVLRRRGGERGRGFEAHPDGSSRAVTDRSELLAQRRHQRQTQAEARRLGVGRHADAVVTHLDDQPLGGRIRLDVEGAGVDAGKITVLAVVKERPEPEAVCEVSELIDAADGGAATILTRRSR